MEHVKEWLASHRLVGNVIMAIVILVSGRLAFVFTETWENWIWSTWSWREVPMTIMTLTLFGMARPLAGNLYSRLSNWFVAFRWVIGNPLFAELVRMSRNLICNNLNVEPRTVEQVYIGLGISMVLLADRWIIRQMFTPFVLYTLWIFGGKWFMTILALPMSLTWRLVDWTTYQFMKRAMARELLIYWRDAPWFPWFVVKPFAPDQLEMSYEVDSSEQAWLIRLSPAAKEMVWMVASLQGLVQSLLFMAFMTFAWKMSLYSFATRCWRERNKAIVEMEKMLTNRDQVIKEAKQNPFHARLHSDPRMFLSPADDENDLDHDESHVQVHQHKPSRAAQLLDYEIRLRTTFKQRLSKLRLRAMERGKSLLNKLRERTLTSTYLHRSQALRKALTDLFGAPDEFERILRQCQIEIDRSSPNSLFLQLAQQLARFPVTRLRNGLNVHFEGEYGVDGGGLTSSLFTLVAEELSAAAQHEEDGSSDATEELGEDGETNKKRVRTRSSSDATAKSSISMFRVLPDSTLMLAPNPKLTDFHYFVLGRLLGVALLLRELIPLQLSSAMLKIMVDEEIASDDVRALDPTYFENRILTLLQPGGVETMKAILDVKEIPFAWMDSEGGFGAELCKNGYKLMVCEENKHEYVQLLSEHYLCGDVREEMQVFLSGFHEVIPKEVIAKCKLDHMDLALLLSGMPEIDVDDWQSNTDLPLTVESWSMLDPLTGADVFERGAATDENVEIVNTTILIKWFWECVRMMDAEQRARLLQFSTGVNRCPPGGFQNLKPRRFNLMLDPNHDHLPSAVTCFNTLRLPACFSKAELKEKLDRICRQDEMVTTFGES